MIIEPPKSLLCPDCDIPMKFSHTYEDAVMPPSGEHPKGTASLYYNVDEFGYGSRTIYVYVCPKCKYETNSDIKFSE